MGKHWFQHFSGKKLKAFREKRGWSQDDLAGRVGTSRSAISTYEHDCRKPRVEMVVRLASAFGIKPRDLLDDVDDDALDMADLRYLQGLRQPEVAARLGIPPVTYQRIEARRAQIDAGRAPGAGRDPRHHRRGPGRQARRPDRVADGALVRSSGHRQCSPRTPRNPLST